MTTLWSNTSNFTSIALHVNIKKETEKAVQFEVVENTKYTFWLPKKALRFQDDIIELAYWCAPGEWYVRAAERYGNFYKR